MEQKKVRIDCMLWIDRVNRIISFAKAEGFEVLQFGSREEKIACAFEMGSSGYRIQ